MKSGNHGAVLDYEREHRSQITKKQILKTKTNIIDGKPMTRKTTSKTTKTLPHPKEMQPLTSAKNLRKKKSNQYWPEQPTTPWKITTQLGTHKPNQGCAWIETDKACALSHIRFIFHRRPILTKNLHSSAGKDLMMLNWGAGFDSLKCKCSYFL